jgi:DNA-binding PadR family transcriptional regulator
MTSPDSRNSSSRHSLSGGSPSGSPAVAGGVTPAEFHILLTLAEGRLHGYGIMQEITRRTEGAMELGPGTLYRSIKQLLARGLIVEAEPEGHEDSPSGPDRRTYAITCDGKALAAEEAQRLRGLVRWAREALILEGGQS